MAILADYTTTTGISLTKCYITVKNSYLQKDLVYGENGISDNNYTVISNIEIYSNQQAFIDRKPFVENKTIVFTFDINSTDNIIKQAYDQIKSSSEFSNIVDV